MDDKITVTGHLDSVIYESPDSLYKVIKIITNENKEIMVVGSFASIEKGLNYDFVGVMKKHPKYGEQLSASIASKSTSFTKEGLISYLSSEKFYGIGAKLAFNIVDKLGLDCINKILEDPKCLEGISGLTLPKREALYQALKANNEAEQVFIRLYSFNLSSKMIEKIYSKYQEKSVSIIENDPYILLYEVDGFGFKKCDILAHNLGYKDDDIRRIKAALLYTLNYVSYNQGFTFLTFEQLINSSKKLLDNNPLIKDSIYENSLEELIEEKKIYNEEDRYYDYILYHQEDSLADRLTKLYSSEYNKFSLDKIKEALAYVEKSIEITYTPLQKEAIINSLGNKLSIITGGPGTGKSTILKGIILCYLKLNNLELDSDEVSYKILLASPTGRASKRMTETTNMKAYTIHKALGYNYDGGFTHDENNPLSCSLLIIDEASMVDVNIASALFRALSNKCQVILVGDSNQLPSVGPGNVLYDLIHTSIFKTTMLNQIMRQANDSDIIKLSQMILNERIDYSVFSNKKELFFYNTESKDLINYLFKIIDRFLSSGGDLQNDLEILAPMYAGVAGIDIINEKIQERYNPEKEKILKRDTKLFKKNDKVLQLKNDAELDIMNGDIGKIIDIIKVDNKDVMIIDFDGHLVNYSAKNIDNLTLAYAISIHKSQGSEFKNVILPILPSYQIMLKKKLIYTAITRAKRKLIIMGKLDSINYSIHNLEYQRQTTLSKRIEDKFNNRIEIKIFDPEIPFDTLGEYDMEGITPYSFM